MKKGPGNRTSLLHWPWSPGSAGNHWFIRVGNYITLPELFYIDRKSLSCLDPYRVYLTFPPFIYKRHHSVSHAKWTQTRNNAKTSCRHEAGKWGLPVSRGRWFE